MAPPAPSSSDPEAAARSRAWLRYRDNLARHLIGIARIFQSRLLQTLSEKHGFEGLRLSFGPFLALVSSRSRPSSEIAQILGISDQASSQLAKLIEDGGYLRRIPNPADRRSKLLTLTGRGRSLVEQGTRGIRAIESDYATLVGATDYGRLTAAIEALDRGLNADAGRASELPSGARPSIAAVSLVAARIQRRLMEAARARGHDGLKMSHGEVLPLVGPEGRRIHEIAAAHRVSRQAISTTTRELESLGYLQREPDPLDGRGVVVRHTPRGLAMIDDLVESLDALERDLLEMLGEQAMADLQHGARRLYRALTSGVDVVADDLSEPGGPSDPADGSQRPIGREIDELAEQLWQRLGPEDSAHLATALEQRTRRTAT